MAGWSSGWVNTDGTTTVANGATLNFTHGLGTTDLVFSVYLADDTNGTNTLSVDLFEIDTQANFYGSQIQGINSSTLTLQLGLRAIKFSNTGGNGGSVNYNSKYIKVVAISAADPAPVPGTGDLCKILSADSGYQMFRNGLTIQWMSSPAFTDQDQSRTVSFPIPFASKPFKVTCSTRNPEGTGLAGVVNIETTNWTNTSVTLMSQAEGDKPEPSRPYYADIIAIGIATVTDCPALGGEDPEGIKVSELVDAQSLKDDDLFLISRDNETDGTYDTSKNATMSSLTEGIKARMGPTLNTSSIISWTKAEGPNNSALIRGTAGFTGDTLPDGTWVLLYFPWQAYDGGGEDDNAWFHSAPIIREEVKGFNIRTWMGTLGNSTHFSGSNYTGHGIGFKISEDPV